MLVKTDGIVLRQYPFSDTSIIVKIYTREYGLKAFLVKGAKSRKSGKSNILKPMNAVFISFHLRENKGLLQLKDCQLQFAPDAKSFGIYKSSIAMFMIEVLNTTITEESISDISKYDFIDYSFEYLKNQSLHPLFYLSFLYQYAIQLGIDIPSKVFTKNEIAEILVEYDNIYSQSMDKIGRREIFKVIEKHYLENLTNYKSLKSIGILEEILS